MEKLSEKLNTLSKSIVGGFLIGLGGTCYLSVDNKIIGAFLFSLGLLAICCTNQLLFTGRASYTMDLIELFIILCGNFIGANLLGYTIGVFKPELTNKASKLVDVKMTEGISIVFLGLLCNILIYFAVEGYKKGQTILLIMCVVAFIICGFEHSIANIFYFSLANRLGAKELLYLWSNVFSNLGGGFIVQCFRMMSNHEE